MKDIDPSILNRYRREGLGKDPNRNVVPAQREEEEEQTPQVGQELRRPLGRLGLTAGTIKNAVLRVAGGTGEVTS